MSSGKVVYSPERRRVKAWFWIRVGQFWGEACRVWRRVSWILLLEVKVSPFEYFVSHIGN